MSVTNKKSIQNIILNIDNETIIADKVNSNHFNKFFSSIAGKLVKKIPNTTKIFDSYLNKQLKKFFFLSPISPEDVEVLISTLSVHTAIGTDSIPTIISKQLKSFSWNDWQIWLIYLFQVDYFTKFLNKLKLIQYLKKETNKTATMIDLSHSYQIIIEKLLHRQLYEFLEFNNFLYTNQFGFHNLHWTNHAIKWKNFY